MEEPSSHETRPSGTREAIANLIPVLKLAVIVTVLVVLVVTAVLTGIWFVLLYSWYPPCLNRVCSTGD